MAVKVPDKVLRSFYLPIELVERMEAVYQRSSRSKNAYVVNAILTRVKRDERRKRDGWGE